MLSIQSLNIRRKETLQPIVECFTLDLKRGESVAIVGESGAGKSSILYSILQLQSKSFELSGKILFNGRDLLSLTENQILSVRGKQIGFVSQNCLQSFDPLFKVGTQLEELLRLYYPHEKKIQRKSRAFQMLSEMELPNVYKMFADELSGGMVQRLAILFAIAASPEILLADELTSALDKRVEDQVMDVLLSQVRKGNRGFLWVTHDLTLAEKFADSIVVMKEGQLVEKGTTASVLKNPKSSYTMHLTENIPRGNRNVL